MPWCKQHLAGGSELTLQCSKTGVCASCVDPRPLVQEFWFIGDRAHQLLGQHDTCGHPYCRGSIRHVDKDDCIGANPCVLTNQNATKNFRASTNVDVPADDWQTGFRTRTHRHLLKNQAIRPNA